MRLAMFFSFFLLLGGGGKAVAMSCVDSPSSDCTCINGQPVTSTTSPSGYACCGEKPQNVCPPAKSKPPTAPSQKNAKVQKETKKV